MGGSILIVEDDKLQQQTLCTLVRRALDYESVAAANGREALDILKKDKDGHIRLVVMDIEMPVMGGLEALEIMRQQYASLPVIMLTGSKDISQAVRAIKLGALDYITKPYEGERMATTIKNALKISVLSKEVSRLKNEKEGRFGFSDIVGHDGGLQDVVGMGRKASSSGIPVLITGETGTGKEIFARAIHGESERSGGPFIAVNCGAIPSQLVESTLFGHEKGSFTGATEKVAGKFREAEGGTIFLDEVGELPLDTQVKLLRALQQKEVEPVGAGKPVPVNVRVISATNRDLQKEVEAGRFREDLFFRLNVLQIEIPPLRERAQDIPFLTMHFIERYSAASGAPLKTVSASAARALAGYPWPGNVRQLENTVNRAMVVGDRNILDVEDFSFLTNGGSASPATLAAGRVPAITLLNPDGSFKSAERIEREAMEIALRHCGENVTRAARALSMAKSTFYRKMGEQSS